MPTEKYYKVVGTSTSGETVLLHPTDTHEACVECAEFITNDEYNTCYDIRIVEVRK